MRLVNLALLAGHSRYVPSEEKKLTSRNQTKSVNEHMYVRFT